ncbi:GNAT family N-acetyltransferase [Cellulomonas sp. PhB143]|uniref:GNAT family N-acetyltransferase n=1 Tax=Cellulomonas sp. PhB143 TaxID=2485186 RepID=UPI000F952B1F|nr:GNAT family protein [Cellulomonas sp. PhB143]ROS73514.1 RimJ/RimL family protein N-acetyltransferase [Cellulomonas sp. PhB143]
MSRGPVVQGEMMHLRPTEARDADRMWESVQDPEASRQTGRTRRYDRSEIDAWCADVSDMPDRYDWAITPGAVRDGALVSDEMIGEIVLDDIRDATRAARLSMLMLPNYRGRGYGSEAIYEVLRFAFAAAPEGLGLHRVELDVLDINPRARSLYETLGFREEGRKRDAYRDGDGFCDAIMMSILEDEFRAGL